MHTEYILNCCRCGKKWKVHKYIYRIEIHDLDLEDFRPWATLGVDLCYQCKKAVEDFIFGKNEEMEEIADEPEGESNDD